MKANLVKAAMASFAACTLLSGSAALAHGGVGPGGGLGGGGRSAHHGGVFEGRSGGASFRRFAGGSHDRHFHHRRFRRGFGIFDFDSDPYSYGCDAYFDYRCYY